jgi:glycosyltransferase involved in cell wall biosynthesis
MKVAAFTPGGTVPSARFRVRQYVEPLRERGIRLVEMKTATSSYPPLRRAARPVWAAARLAELAGAALRSHRYDAVLLQREMISSLVTLEPLTRSPRILDIDDAVHLLRDGRAARRLAQISHAIIAGNSWLADWYRAWNPNVHIVPTAVDAARYRPRAAGQEADSLVVGWIGTSANFPYLLGIEEAIAAALRAQPRLVLRIVSDRPPEFTRIAPDRWRFVPWTEAGEVADIQAMDVGIMPLADTEWAKGKCSFKMLQYMSCGLPVVVSPVGMNSEVLAQGRVGISADGAAAWTDALCDLAASQALREAMGAEGRRVVERRYDRSVVARQLGDILSAVGVSSR